MHSNNNLESSSSPSQSYSLSPSSVSSASNSYGFYIPSFSSPKYNDTSYNSNDTSYSSNYNYSYDYSWYQPSNYSYTDNYFYQTNLSYNSYSSGVENCLSPSFSSHNVKPVSNTSEYSNVQELIEYSNVQEPIEYSNVQESIKYPSVQESIKYSSVQESIDYSNGQIIKPIVNKNRLDKSRSRKHQLSDEAVEIMNEWFDTHMNNPYPTQEEKERIAYQGGITVKQVTAWFSNRRNRSQNTKPKRMKRVLEKEMTEMFNKIVCDQPSKMNLLEQFKSTLSSRI